MLLLSIHPTYASKILSGVKQVEFRKRVPRRASEGDLLAIYASSPISSLIATATIERVVTAHPRSLWRRFRHIGGISFAEYANYFGDAETAVAIFVRTIQPIEVPISLAELRRRRPGFHPPQQFAYIRESDCIFETGEQAA